MKIGVLGVGFACEERLDERLAPWFNLAEKHNLIFSFVSARFKEYEELNINKDNVPTLDKFKDYLMENKISFLNYPPEPLLEHEVRNIALKPLLEENCDFIWLLDLSDEYYTEKQIETIIEYISRKDNKYYSWYKIPMKNYIFSGKEWVYGFEPPRIFSVNLDYKTKLYRFHWDNDADYEIKEEGTLYNYVVYPHKTVPKNLIGGGIYHLTWTHENGADKEKYQRSHFKGLCSYKFNNEINKLEFDLDGYYKKLNIIPPTVYKDE